MNDNQSESQRRAWNNDGMDPDWKPDLTPLISDPIEKLSKLIHLCHELSLAFDGVIVKEALQDDSYSTKVTKGNKFWREFLNAYNDVRFK